MTRFRSESIQEFFSRFTQSQRLCDTIQEIMNRFISAETKF